MWWIIGGAIGVAFIALAVAAWRAPTCRCGRKDCGGGCLTPPGGWR